MRRTYYIRKFLAVAPDSAVTDPANRIQGGPQAAASPTGNGTTTAGATDGSFEITISYQ